MDKKDLKKQNEAPELIPQQKISRERLVSYYRDFSKKKEVIKNSGKRTVGGLSVAIGALLVLFGAFFVGEDFGWYDIATSEPSLVFSVAAIITGLVTVFFGRAIFKILFSLLFIVFILGGLLWFVGGNTIAGLFIAGTSIVEEVEVSRFSSFTAYGRGNVYIAQGSGDSLVLEGDRRVISHISATTREGDLEIRYDGFLWRLLSYLYSDLNIYLTVDDISSINLIGAYSLETNEALSTNTLTIKASGTVQLDMDINTDSLRIEVNGSSSASLRGQTLIQTLDMTGRVKYNAQDLASDSVFISVRGFGDIKVRADTELDVSGAGSVRVGYRGEPAVKQNAISGSGHVYKIEENGVE